MQTRATHVLANLADADFFEKIAEGMQLCIRNSVGLLRDAKIMHRRDRRQSFEILAAYGHEEIAKYLILLDAVRCPRTDQKNRSEQLRRFNNHLAKGLYLNLYQGYPANLAEVRRRADQERASHYLDGPSDTDWIFRNEILSHREASIYVDYVVTDEGPRWQRPSFRFLPGHSGASYRLKAHKVALCLYGAGFSTPKALAIVADVWRPLVFEDQTDWGVARDANRQTLKRLDQDGLLRPCSPTITSPIVNDWLFPLYDVDLSERKVPIEELRSIQEDWVPDW